MLREDGSRTKPSRRLPAGSIRSKSGAQISFPAYVLRTVPVREFQFTNGKDFYRHVKYLARIWIRMHRYMQTVVEAVNPTSSHSSEVLLTRIDLHLQNQSIPSTEYRSQPSAESK